MVAPTTPSESKPPEAPLRLLFVAGEPSGDARAAAVAREIAARVKNLEMHGFGGPGLAAAGVRLLRDMTVDMAIVGLVEVLKKAPKILSVWRQARAAIRSLHPNAVILVDYPGFNLGLLAPFAHRLGIPVLYYIVPQFWAWHGKRVHRLRRFCRLAIPIFPFEEDLLHRAGVSAAYGGHPLLDELAVPCGREEARAAFRLDPHAPLVGLAPGSRRREVAKHLPLLLDAAARVREAVPEAGFVLVRAATVPPDDIQSHLSKYNLPITVLDPPGHDREAAGRALALRAALDFAWVKSGTSTLETALLGTPMAVVYKVSPLTAFIGRRVIRVPFMGMPNLVAGERVVPELLQENLTVDGLAACALRVLQDPAAAAADRESLLRVKERFGPPGAAARTAGLILQTLGREP